MTKHIDYSKYHDRVLAVWMGKSLGGIVGAPYEGHKIFGHMKPDELWPKTIYPNDDLDIQVVWLEMLEERGCRFDCQDLIDCWQDRCWYNFAEYGVFLNNVQRGIRPPLSGSFNNVFFRESMGCPIRAEIWGVVAPGNTELAADMARLDGQLDHNRHSVQAECFWAACIAEAICADSLEQALAAGRKQLPEDSLLVQIYEQVRVMAGEQDIEDAWRILVRRYGHRDGSKGEINFAFTLLSLWTGELDLKKTLAAANNLGWDTDCTAATAGALVGALVGTEGLPADWLEKMGPRLTCDVNVRHKTALLKDLAADTCKVGLEMCLERNKDIQLSGVPEDVRRAVEDRHTSRTPRPEVHFEALYPEKPVLGLSNPVRLHLRLLNRSADFQSGSIALECEQGLRVSPVSTHVELEPGVSQRIEVLLKRSGEEQPLWDRNLIQASWTAEGSSETRQFVFGAAGARPWLVYGPYWDIWDTRRAEVCPFRNEEVCANPHLVPGGWGESGTRQFVRLDRPYLDEQKLLKEDLPEEHPFRVERGEDHLDASHLGGFTGEGAYYLVRNLVSREPVDCQMGFASSMPFIAWLDGEEICRNEECKSWSPHDMCVRAQFDDKPRRLVIKLARQMDDFRFSLCFLKLDIPGDKTVGVSYMLDQMGDIAPGR